ncbi:MAG TPA: protein-disulfide reductase DsbD domain-containing protein [Planctomycetota bacterium]|nr:protein-disulfide reductase DsbD domain-containing protein [Planctomycetota bacterium]
MDARIRWLSCLSLLLALLAPLSAQRGDEKFSLEAKFEPASAKPGDTVTLVLSAVVVDGWHAYGTREKVNIPVALAPKKLQLAGLELVGQAQIPPGEPHSSAIGDSFPLPNEFTVKQTMKVPPGMAAGDVSVKGALDYQICDANMCLPPTGAKFSAKLQVLAGAAAPTAPPELGTKPGLKLVPDEKVQIKASFDPATARGGEATTLVIDVTVDERYHAYGTLETTNTPVSLDGAKLDRGSLELVGAPDIPLGEKKQQFGMDTYRLPHEFQVKQVLRVPAGTAPGAIPVKGMLGYQVCDENMCDQATEGAFVATLTVEAGEARAGMTTKPVPPPAVATPKEPQGGNPFGGSLWALILACIGGGLFALAMPCTYPMIPITFSFFTKQAEKRGGNVLPLALTYGLGIIAMFTIVGAALSEVIIDVVNHWTTNLVIGAMFLFFAFVLFGWINLQPPQFLMRASGKASATGGYLGVFFMGATLVITSFTCTAPIVGSLLANVAQFGTGRVAFGMAIFGLTMALPFVVLSLMPTRVKTMPRSGEWMETLKVSLGFVELAAALKFVSMVDFALGWQILPRELFLLLWTTIFGLWAMYLFGILRKAGTPNEGVGAGRMAGGMFVSLLATYFLFGGLGYKLDFYMTNFVPGYSAESVIARGAGGSGEATDGKGHAVGKHRIVLDNQPKAMEVALAEDKLLLYNFTGFN